MRCIYLSALAMVLVCQSPGAARADFYVSNQGTDSGTCGDHAGPCASIYQAISNSKTTPDAVIRCMNPVAIEGIFPNLTITQSVTIDCKGSYLSYQRGDSGTVDTGFIIDGPNINVTLRGIYIYSSAFEGRIGVEIRQAASVTIEDCKIDNLTSEGVYDHRSTAGKLMIKDTFISRISSGPAIAIVGAARNAAIIDNVTLDSNLHGISVAGLNKATITGSHITNNAGNGVQGDANAFVIVDGSTISSNGSGIVSNSSVRLSNNNIAFNNRAIGGAAGTYGNNRFSGNTTIGTTPTPLGGASPDVGQQ